MLVTYKEGVTGSSPVAPTWIPKTGLRASMIARLDEA